MIKFNYLLKIILRILGFDLDNNLQLKSMFHSMNTFKKNSIIGI